MFLVSTCALWQTRDSVEYLWVDTHTYRAITLNILCTLLPYTLNLLMGKIHVNDKPVEIGEVEFL